MIIHANCHAFPFALLFLAAFNAILFLQSGLDKVFDYNGNRQWLDEHFSKSILKGSVGLLLPVITLVELAAGTISVAAVVLLFLGRSGNVLLAGTALSATALLMLFFGQRVAKDYAGAATLAMYFAVEMLGLIYMNA